MSLGNRLEVAFATGVGEYVDRCLAVLAGQVENHAFATEAFADVVEQFGQINIFGIDFVDDDHAT